ncbi:MAG: hypothetical protein KA902_03215 [Arenimonas sp.]|nr:hypothetical protein [Arenimonas sp.]
MASEVLINFIIFTSIVLIIRAIIEGIVRYRALSSNADATEVLKALSQERAPFQLTALKWGLGLGSLGLGFLVIEVLKLQPDQPGTWGVITLSIAAGLLAFYAFVKKQEK